VNKKEETGMTGSEEVYPLHTLGIDVVTTAEKLLYWFEKRETCDKE